MPMRQRLKEKPKFLTYLIFFFNSGVWLFRNTWIHLKAYLAVLRILTRIRIHFGQLDPDPHWEYGSGSRRAKMTHKRLENSSFEVLNVLFQGLKTSPVA
jgi:hypothetical protein